MSRRWRRARQLWQHPLVTTGFDLSAYLRRVHFETRPAPDLATLSALHRAHVEAIPFENLDIQMGRPIELAPPALQAKLVDRLRGGYCFEQNGLFALALAAVGFAVETCEARVRAGAGEKLLPRTHMVLMVSCDGRDWLADVGFGGDGLLEPLVVSGEPATQAGYTYRVASEGRLRVLQRATGDTWEDLYVVLPDPVYPVDYQMANWYTSTSPQSPFVQTVTAQRCVGGARYILRNLTYTERRNGKGTTREMSRGEIVPLLRDVFGIAVDAEARFRALDAVAGAGRPPRDA